MAIRQPIVSVLGHVDHGKTTLLDRVRGTTVADREAGRITQHIGATEVPLATVHEICGPLLKGKTFRIPGLLFIDTPGHHAFTTLRARGGALADIAVLVVDLFEGLMPQTREAIRILKGAKRPFVVAANKVDRATGWQSQENRPFLEAFAAQPERAVTEVETKLYELIEQLHDAGFAADRYDRVKDFTKNVAIVPVSGRTGEGVPDLLMVLAGLSQRFLEEKLAIETEGPARGTVLEVKEERGLGLTIDTIVYDGILRKGDTIVVGGASGPIVTTVRALLKPKPLDEIRDPRDRFDSVDEVAAATGLKISAPDLDGVVAGAPLHGVAGDDEAAIEAARAAVKKEFAVSIDLSDQGILLKADSLGSLEALARELRDSQIPVKMASVGDVSRRDLTEAETIQDPLFRVILAFHVKVLPEAREALHDSPAKLLENKVIYALIDEYKAWSDETKREMEEASRAERAYPGKILLLQDHVFRVSKPAIVGVRVLAGRIRQGQGLLRDDGKDVGEVKSIRSGEETKAEARQGEELALAIDGATVGRQIEPGMVLYVDMPEQDAREHLRQKTGTLSHDEFEALQETVAIKRKQSKFWAM